MKTVYLFPPNYAEINRAFKVRGKAVLFCYGSTIYNPGRIKIPPQLLVHEAVHSRQQEACDGPEHWWRRYIEDKQFRLEQEITAHQAEYRDMCERGNWCYLDAVAARLASPLYGRLIDFPTARELVRAGAPSHESTASACQ